ncbi:MAG: ATP-binding protein, partial [Candidatus Eremiobacterota bacterium]
GLSARLEVEDNGPGIPPEVAERIFEPFFSTRPIGKAAGLGLAVSQQIVRAHDGSLMCFPGSGGGTLFRMELPRL